MELNNATEELISGWKYTALFILIARKVGDRKHKTNQTKATSKSNSLDMYRNELSLNEK